MGYTMKNSPINKGTASNPSPVKVIGILTGLALGAKALFTGASIAGLGTAAVIGKGIAGAALTTGLSKGIKGITDAKQNRADSKLLATTNKASARSNLSDSTKTKIGGGASIV